MTNHASEDHDRSADRRPDAPPERLEAPDEAEAGLNWRPVVAVVATAAAIGFFVVDGLDSETYFFTVDEAVAEADSVGHQQIRVKGSVVEGSIDGEEGDVGRTFSISEKGEQLRVHYDQALPDTFEPDVQVVATGQLDDQGRLEASEIMVKCPSRYEGKPPTAHEGGSDGPRSSR